MRPRSKAFVALVVGIAASTIAAACSLDDGQVTLLGASGDNVGHDGSFPDAPTVLPDGATILPDGNVITTPDAGPDADYDDSAVASDATTLPDATSMPDAGTCPTGQSLCAATGTCVGNCTAQCSGSTLSCSDGGTAVCVTTCEKCGTQTTACFRCPFDQGFNANGTCEDPSSGSSCVKDQGYLHCGCGLYDVSNCPGDDQVCRPTLIPGVGACKTCGEDNTSGKDCKANGKCNTGKMKCE